MNPQNEHEADQGNLRGGRGGRRGGPNQPRGEGDGQNRRRNNNPNNSTRGEFFDQKRRERQANDRDTNRLLEEKDH